MKQHPRRRSKRRTPAPTLHDLLRQPDADFYRLPDLEIRSGRIVTDGCRRVLDFAPQKITLDVGSTVITFYGTALRIESLNGKRLTEFPFTDVLDDCKPVFETVKGWNCDISKCRKKEDLPKEALDYIRYIERACECKIRYVSVGAERDAYIEL